VVGSPDLIESLINIPDMQGDSVGLRVLSKGSFSHINKFIEASGELKRFENSKNGVNAVHAILGNLSLNSKEKLLLIDTVV
jgi:hypothetical protein